MGSCSRASCCERSLTTPSSAVRRRPCRTRSRSLRARSASRWARGSVPGAASERQDARWAASRSSSASSSTRVSQVGRTGLRSHTAVGVPHTFRRGMWRVHPSWSCLQQPSFARVPRRGSRGDNDVGPPETHDHRHPAGPVARRSGDHRPFAARVLRPRRRGVGAVSASAGRRAAPEHRRGRHAGPLVPRPRGAGGAARSRDRPVGWGQRHGRIGGRVLRGDDRDP